MARLIPGLSGRALWTPRLLLALPYLITAGLLLFGAAGIAAGLTGMPRRVLDVSLDGAAPAAWLTLSRIIGAGGLIMAAGLLLYAGALGGTLVAGRRPLQGTVSPVPIASGPVALRGGADRAAVGLGPGRGDVRDDGRRLRTEPRPPRCWYRATVDAEERHHDGGRLS